jgi:TolA-binding protein
MTLEQPPRLKDGELGPILRAADHADVSPERLADNAARVKALIAAGTTTALWKLLAGLLLLGLLAIPIVGLVRDRDDATPTPVPTQDRVVVAEAADAGAPDAIVAEPDASEVSEPAPPRPRPAPRVAVAPPDAGVPDAAEPPPSDLPAQIELYNAARAAAAAGKFALAIDRIDELFRKFPSTQLRADAELTRADVLARGGRLAEAAQAFEALAKDDAHRGRRGELLRTLGDLYRQQHDCTRAADAYNRALAGRIGERDRADAERGRDRCTPR